MRSKVLRSTVHATLMALMLPGLATPLMASAAIATETATITEFGLKKPTQCHASLINVGGFTFAWVTWADQSDNEDGFTVEVWEQDGQDNGHWAFSQSRNLGPNTEETLFFVGSFSPSLKFRVQAFNVAGVSGWSNWARIRL